ncbi:MAG: PAS domain S-box protein [Chloroflexi bacterium]|nr:PAS domain S-box protein [Chloroflexota bacterium]
MLEKVKLFLAPKIFEDGEKTRVARLLNILLLATIPSLALFIIISVLFSPTMAQQWPIIGFLFLLAVGVYGLMRKGRVKLASFSFATGLWAALTFAAITSGGVQSPGYISLINAVFVAGLLLGTRVGITFAAVSIFTGLALIYAELNGLLPPPWIDHTLISFWLPQGFSFIMAAMILYLATSSIKQALNRAQLEIVERKQAEGELREAYQNIDNLFNAIGHQTLILDPEFHIRSANEAVLEKIGMSHEEIRGKKCYEIYHEANEPPVGCPCNKIKLTDQIETAEMEIEAFDETYLVSCTPIHDEAGQLAQVIHIATDITELKHTHDELQHLKKFNESIIHNMLEGIMVMDVEGIITFINPALLVLLGYSPEEIIGQHWKNIVPQDQHEIADGAEERRARGEIGHYELILTNKKGISFPVLVGSGIMYDKEEFVGSIAVFTDISESKLAEEALRESELRYRAVVEDQTEMIIRYLPDNTLTFVNEAFCTHTGKQREELIAQSWVPLVSKDNREMVLKHIASLDQETPFVTFEQRSFSRNKELQWEQWTNRVLFDENDQIIEYQGIGRVITKRKQTEEALQRHTHDLGERVKELNCLYGISKLIEKEGLSMAEILEEAVEIIPPGWHYPEITCARIEVRGNEYKTTNYKETKWKQEADIVLNTEKIGAVEVNYLEEMPELDEGPFLKEERNLINVIAERLGDMLARYKQDDQIQCQIQRLGALREIDRAISGSLDLRITLNVVLDQVVSQLNLDAAAVLLVDSLHSLKYTAGKGFRSFDEISSARLRVGESYAGRAALERRTFSLSDIQELDVPSEFNTFLQTEGFVHYRAVPLISKGEVLGVLEIYNRTAVDTSAGWMEFLETLTGQAAIAINNATLFDSLQSAKTGLEVAYDATLEGWVRALDMRDKETEGHTRRVTEVTLRLAAQMGVPSNKLIHYSRGALLHDIGKMTVGDEILHKPGPLSDEEWEIMRKHPEYARDFLAGIEYLEPALEIPYSHHEKWDGTGYPQGLEGEQIPLAARIFAIVDVWDALSNDRPYRKAWSKKKVHKHLRDNSGSHFDPQVVEAFSKTLENERELM